MAHRLPRAVLLMTGFVSLAMPASARAQDGLRSVTATGEYEHLTEDEGFLGTGVGGGVGVEWRVTERTAVAVDVSAVHHVRDLEFFAIAFDGNGRPAPLPYTERWQGTATFVMASLSRSLAAGSVRPVISGGVGYMWQGGTTRGPVTTPQVPQGFVLQPGSLETRQGHAVDAFTFEVTGGVDAALSPRLTVRPFAGVRLVNTENAGPKYILRAGARLALVW